MEELFLKAGVMLIAALGILLFMADLTPTKSERHPTKLRQLKK